ncbi:MAG TPA: phosphate starvation-inducible protein PhoH [Firmicutes bacterium]|nr:phosphate starvation-inducible protein PhoH [Bacillota bacterium]
MINSVITLEINPEIAPILFGQLNQNLRQISEELDVNLSARGNTLHISGDEEDVSVVLLVLETLRDQVAQGIVPGPHEIKYTLDLVRDDRKITPEEADLTTEVIVVTNRGKKIFPRTLGQKRYINAIRHHLLTFGIGPAGTGKTFLAVAMAVAALQSKEVSRIILTRPAVEAGEKLGFLPGDLQEKVDPYLRPLNDALFDILGGELYQKYMEKRIIEIAPLAYMRGRTLDDSFIILDEAQNTTPEQMKMFLTRMGFGSKVIVNGDITQVDLPKGSVSGLTEVATIFQHVPDIAIVTLGYKDVVRHELVQKIIRAYEEYEKQNVKEENGV